MNEEIVLLRRAMGNCYMMAKREIARLINDQAYDRLALDRWRHVQRFCETAGSTGSILRGLDQAAWLIECGHLYWSGRGLDGLECAVRFVRHEDAERVRLWLVARDPDRADSFRSTEHMWPAPPDPPEGWQPMDTAPKDGTEVLIVYAAARRQRVTTARFKEHGFNGVMKRWWQCDIGTVEPTLWRRLPDPPEAESK